LGAGIHRMAECREAGGETEHERSLSIYGAHEVYGLLHDPVLVGSGARRYDDTMMISTDYFQDHRVAAGPVAERIIDFVERHYASPISLRDVADAFGYSPCHLTTTFRQATGTPITAWIIKRRIVAAQQLLGEANVDVATACEAVGFSDLCYFTRQFVRHVGMTPGRFRSTMNRTGQRA
jgi:AraC-like DNA-binding protein